MTQTDREADRAFVLAQVLRSQELPATRSYAERITAVIMSRLSPENARALDGDVEAEVSSIREVIGFPAPVRVGVSNAERERVRDAIRKLPIVQLHSLCGESFNDELDAIILATINTAPGPENAGVGVTEPLVWALQRIADLNGSAADMTPWGRGYNAGLKDAKRIALAALDARS